MQLWDDIVNTALIGSDRQKPPGLTAGGALGELLAKAPADDPAGELLSKAAVVGLYAQAGRLPARREDSPFAPPCPPDAQPRLSPLAAQHLAAMVAGEYRQVLPEFLAAAAAAGRRVPEEWLPGLLDLGRVTPALREALPAVIGRRGRWLAGQNPEWAYVAGDAEDESAWETAGKASRLAMLRRLRQADPAKARALVASTWAKESADDRTEFLQAFAVNLSDDDEATLEAALDDRSRTVRKAAADLLCHLPRSRLSERMRQRATPLLAYAAGRKAHLDVTLPGEPDAAARRDGVEVKHPPGDVGQKQWWLFQLVAAVAPSTWSKAWGKTPEEILAASKGEWEDLLLEAWLTAADRCGDAAWAEALFPRDVTLKFTAGAEAKNVLSSLKPDRRAALVAARLRADPNPFGDGSITLATLRAYRQPWTEDLARAALDAARAATAKPTEGQWMFRTVMKEFAERMPPSLATEAAKEWPTATNDWDQWKSAVNDFLTLLQFRHDMLKAVSSDG